MSQQAPSNWHLMQGCFTFCSFLIRSSLYTIIIIHNLALNAEKWPALFILVGILHTHLSLSVRLIVLLLDFPVFHILFFSLYGINLVFILVCILTDSSWRLSHSACFYTSTNGAKLTTSLLFCYWWHCWVSVLHWSNQFPTKLLSCLLGYIVTFQIFKWNQSCRSLSPLFAYLLCVLLAHRLSYGLDSEGCVRHVGSHHRRHHAA